MQPINFKTTKPLDYSITLRTYMIQNYDVQSVSDSLKEYFSSLTQTQNVMSKILRNKLDLGALKEYKSILVEYINQISIIKEKVPFGPQDKFCRTEFVWTDVIHGKRWVSYNVEFEYYNLLYNLATLYFLMGIMIGKEAKEKVNECKEAMNKYKNAMYVFNVIKEEAVKKINQRELPFDLYPPYLDFCIECCTIAGSVEILTISKQKNLESTLEAEICLGLAKSCSKALNLSKTPPLDSGGDTKFRNFLENRIIYYEALSFAKLKKLYLKKYDKTGLDFGVALFYQGLFVSKLLECEKTLPLCGCYVNTEEFKARLEQEKKRGAGNGSQEHKHLPSIYS